MLNDGDYLLDCGIEFIDVCLKSDVVYSDGEKIGVVAAFDDHKAGLIAKHRLRFAYPEGTVGWLLNALQDYPKDRKVIHEVGADGADVIKSVERKEVKLNVNNASYLGPHKILFDEKGDEVAVVLY